jgi:WD40 repeat protein
MKLAIHLLVALALTVPGTGSRALGQASASLKLVDQFKAHDLQGESLIQVFFSPLGTNFATVASDGFIKVWGKANIKTFQFSEQPRAMLFNGRFDPDNTTLLSAAYNGTATRWSLKGLPPQHYGPHLSGVTDVEMLPAQAGVVTSSDDGSIRFWSNDGRLVKRIERPGVSRHLAVAGKRQLVAVAQDISAITIVSIDGKLLQSFEANQGRLNDIIFSPNEQRLLTTGFDGTIKIWDLEDPVKPPKLTTTIQASETGWVNGLALNRAGVLASVADDGRLRLWNLQGENLATLQLSNKHLLSCSFSPNGEKLVVASSDGMVSELVVQP